jgi:hypothetical protein
MKIQKANCFCCHHDAILNLRGSQLIKPVTRAVRAPGRPICMAPLLPSPLCPPRILEEPCRDQAPLASQHPHSRSISGTPPMSTCPQAQMPSRPPAWVPAPFSTCPHCPTSAWTLPLPVSRAPSASPSVPTAPHSTDGRQPWSPFSDHWAPPEACVAPLPPCCNLLVPCLCHP